MIAALFQLMTDSAAGWVGGLLLAIAVWALFQSYEIRHYREMNERCHMEIVQLQSDNRKLGDALQVQNRAVAAAGNAAMKRQAAARKALDKAKRNAAVHVRNAKRMLQAERGSDNCQAWKRLIDEYASKRP